MGVKYEIRKIIFDALTDTITDYSGETVTDYEDTALTRGFLINLDGIYDVAPQVDDPAVPSTYSVIGSQISRPLDTDTTRGATHLVRIFTHSRSNSAKAVEDVQDAMFDALHYQPQQVGTTDTVLVKREGSDILPGPDGRFYGVDEYLFMVMKI